MGEDRRCLENSLKSGCLGANYVVGVVQLTKEN